MSTNGDDPLDELVVDQNQVDRRRVAKTLKPVLNVDTDGEFVPRTKFWNLGNPRRVTALLLGQWVSHEKGMTDSETVPPSKLAEEARTTENSLRKYAVDLEFIVQDDRSGGYRVREHCIGDATKFLREAQ